MNLRVLYLIIFLRAVFTVVYQRRRIIIILLGLEGVTLIVILVFLRAVRAPNFIDRYLFVIILSYGVIEASLGLSLLVVIARKAGRDLVISLTLRKC